ncbi:MAG: SPOR domain-containing protein [bacterium]|nr:SPOR domain-containing protein [bacterium]
MEIANVAFSYFVLQKEKKDLKVEKKIWSYIIHYLHKHNELCLSGFGRFATQVNEFTVDPVAKKITPSRKRIYFQTGEFSHTPQFIDFVATITQEEKGLIVDKLNVFIKSLFIQLKSNPKTTIEDFGTFRQNVMGDLEFDSNQTLFFDDQSFGLQPIHFAANLLKTKRIVLEAPVEEELELTQMRESALKELKVLLDNARVAESKENKPNSKIFPIVATILTLVLLINLGFFLFSGPVNQLKQHISQMNILGKTGEIIDSQQSETLQVPSTPAVMVQEIIRSEPITNSDSLTAHIGAYLGKTSFELDSLQYALVQPEIMEAPKGSLELPVENTPEPVKLVPQYSAAQNPVEVIDPGVKYYDAPNMMNVDAAQNGIEKGFYVIAGAFKNKGNAERLKDKMVKKGDSAAVVFKPSTYPYYLVSFQKSKSLNQALNILEKKEDANPSIWVYCAY